MKKTPLPKLIKWVLSGAMHPFALFDEDRLRKQAVVELGPEYATKPLPWAYDEDTSAEVINWALEGMLHSLRKYYKSDAHFRQHAVMISERVCKNKDLECPGCQADIRPGMGICPGCHADLDYSLPPGTIVETTTTTYLDPYHLKDPLIESPLAALATLEYLETL